MESQFTRTELLLGQEAMKRLRASRVVVFGVGGVGGYVVEVLARSGVGAIAMVDPDRVNLSNLNRQIVALHSTVGRLKVDVMEERIRDINPDCEVRKFPLFYLPENADEIDLSPYDYVVDCVDTVKAKLEIIRRCHRLQIPVISSMGAANKLDPTAFRVSDIAKTSMDPLAKVLRKTLRKEGIQHFKVVYSEEKAPSQPPPTGEGVPQNGLESKGQNEPPSTGRETVTTESKNPQNNCIKEPPPVGGGWRGPCKQPLPSCAFVPAACGLVVGGEVVKNLAGV
ncbi:MAG: tRNA threonylcarbamoyladenosine dehydratase [Prevotella sp.]|nr:tRNA threonylcarbamoyladenosine dehydratase [Prevotella sp.]